MAGTIDPTAFHHGARAGDATTTPEIVDSYASSVTVMIVTCPKGPVNVPAPFVGAGGRAAAAATFGVNKRPGDLTSGQFFTGPDSWGSLLDQKTAAPFVVINVCDPAAHKSALAGASYPVVGGVATLPRAYISSVEVRSAAGSAVLVEGVDYRVNADGGTVAALPGGALAGHATLWVTCDYVDPTKVTTADVIGGVDDAGRRSGVHLLKEVRSVTKMKPEFVVAPYYVNDRPVVDGAPGVNPVIAEMLPICESLRAFVVASHWASTDAAAIDAREDFGAAHLLLYDQGVWKYDAPAGAPALRSLDAVVCGVWAGLNWWESPSNKIVNGVVAPGRRVEFGPGQVDSQANWLNQNFVSTLIQDEGLRLWGNRAVSGHFANGQRIKWTLYRLLEEETRRLIDLNITRGLVDYIIEYGRGKIAFFVGVGALIGGDIKLNPELNAVGVRPAGKAFYDISFTVPEPLEDLVFMGRESDKYYVDVFAINVQ